MAPDELDVPGYFLISDLFGTPAEIVEVADRGSLGNIAAVSIRSATLLMATACLLFVLLAWLLAQRFVVRPVRDLSEEIHRIRATGDLKVDSVFRRSDEVGRLSSDFAGLTAELAQAQEELELARDEAIEASNTKSEFLARMSHEIRTPLNGVLGMAEVLRSTSLSGRQAAITDTIQRSGRTLLELINDILDFSKIEAGKMQLMPVESDLRSLLEDTMATFAMQAENKGVDLRLQVEPPLEGSVWLDPVRVRQVLNNLLDNALKFTLEGSVTLSVHGEQTSRGTLLTEFAVTDTGIGIEPELLQVIFDSFAQADSGTTRRFGGTGLGLTICRQLVELMGGHIGVSSEPNEGSRFVFTLDLPMDPEWTAASKYRAPNSEAKRVLIADDNPVDQTVTAASVRYLDLEPTVVEGGERAVQAAACGRYAAILLDCAMPEVDGYAAARAIRAQERESSRQRPQGWPVGVSELRRALAPLLDEANA